MCNNIPDIATYHKYTTTGSEQSMFTLTTNTETNRSVLIEVVMTVVIALFCLCYMCWIMLAPWTLAKVSIGYSIVYKQQYISSGYTISQLCGGYTIPTHTRRCSKT